MAVSEFGSMVTSSWDDAKAGEMPPIVIKIDKNAMIDYSPFLHEFSLVVSLINFTQNTSIKMIK